MKNKNLLYIIILIVVLLLLPFLVTAAKNITYTQGFAASKTRLFDTK